MADYTYITDPQELFAKQDSGETIEFRTSDGDYWVQWAGIAWNQGWQFRIVKPEPKLVPHWPAVLRHSNDQPVLSVWLFTSIEDAHKIHPTMIRLATEYPPIMLEVKEC